MLSSKLPWLAFVFVAGSTLLSLQGCQSADEPSGGTEDDLRKAVSCSSLTPSKCSKQLDCKLETFDPPTPPQCVQKTCDELQATDSDERAQCGRRVDCKVVYGRPPTPPQCVVKACEDLSATDSNERGLCQQRSDCHVVYSGPPNPPRCEAQ